MINSSASTFELSSRCFREDETIPGLNWAPSCYINSRPHALDSALGILQITEARRALLTGHFISRHFSPGDSCNRIRAGPASRARTHSFANERRLAAAEPPAVAPASSPRERKSSAAARDAFSTCCRTSERKTSIISLAQIYFSGGLFFPPPSSSSFNLRLFPSLHF